jgi:tetratricopeptide (TPR) repeat protein
MTKTRSRNERFVAAGGLIAGPLFCLLWMACLPIPSGASDDDARVRAGELITRGKQLNASGDPGAPHTLKHGISLASASGDQEALSEGFRAMAVYHIAHADPDKGLEFGERALLSARVSGNSTLEARALQQIGNAYFYLHRPRTALEKFKASLSLIRGLADSCTEADLLKDIGITYRNLGRYDEALEHLHEARELLASMDASNLTASVQESIATCYSGLGARRLAIEAYEQVLETSRRNRDESLTIHILTRMGYLLSDLNEPERALQRFREAMAMAETTKALRVQAWILMGMSGPLASLGRLEEAIQANRRCIELHRKMKSEMGMAQDLTSLAQLCVQRDPAAALHHFQRSLTIYDRYEDQVLWSTYHGMGRAHQRLGEQTRAIEYFQKAIDEIETVRGRLTSDQHRASFLGKYE